MKTIKISPERVHLHIVLPNNIDKHALKTIKSKQDKMSRCTISTARNRPAEFYFYLEGNDLHIVDYPSNIVTSYDTARIILEMDADDTYDETASERFVAKEMLLYESTLKTILNDTFVHQVIEEHYSNSTEEEKRKNVPKCVKRGKNRLTITRYE